MPDFSEKTKGPKVSVDEIMAKIREEVEQRKKLSAPKTNYDRNEFSEPSTTIEPAYDGNIVKKIFWKYGLKYARSIKKIPILRSIAEKCYWRLANRQSHYDTGTMAALTNVQPDMSINWNYSGFLKEIRKQGLKGKIKQLIFKFIGFFAWWQEQINAALYQELMNQKARIEDVSNRLATLDRTAGALNQELMNQKARIEDVSNRLATLDRTADALNQEIVNQSTSIQDVKQQFRMHELKIFEQQRTITLFLEEERKRGTTPISGEQLENMVKEENHLLDAMYVAFEDRFRGKRDEIKERQKIYLPYLEKANAGGQGAPVLDIGCGRGEWLELLKENGCQARGVDTNRLMIELCGERGFDVVESDALYFLRGQASNHFGAITGFHIIEHLPPGILIALFDESLRALKPGGLIIFETPNPENLIVGACNFYLDPTHRKPLPPDQIKFIAEQRGFVSTEIIRLHKMKDPEYTGQESVDEVIHRLNMEQDYSIIGYKP